MKNKTNTIFGVLIVGMIISLLSTNFTDSFESQVYGEAEPTVFAEEGESSLPPLPFEEVVEAPSPDQDDAVDVEEADAVLIKEECRPTTRTKRRVFGGTSRAGKSYGLKIFRRNK